jgi:putative hemolysin
MLDFLIVILCLFINAFFSAYEMAFVTISRLDIEEMDEAKSIIKLVKGFKKNPERTLSVIQIGITLVGAIAAAVGGTGAVEFLEPYLVEKFNISKTFGEAISVTAVIIPLTYFSVVFGELLPKTIALRHPKAILSFGTNALFVIDRMLSPIVSFLEISTGFLLRKLGLSTKKEQQEGTLIVDVGTLPQYHKTFVQNLISLKGKSVQKSLMSREQVALLHFSNSKEEVRKKLGMAPHTRFPVLDGETLVGFLHARVFNELQNAENISWESLIRPMIQVRKKEKILEVFLKMQKQRQHLAGVLDDDDKFIGIISIEDILEEVVGDIDEDYDPHQISQILSRRGKMSLRSH